MQPSIRGLSGDIGGTKTRLAIVGVEGARPRAGAGDFLTLRTGTPNASGNMAVIAAGTGLGEAGLFWDGQRHHPFATEGGHVSFSPGDELEIALLRYLQQL